MIDKRQIEGVFKKFELNDYRWFNPTEIVTGHWVRMKCMFGCSEYGNAACPPNVPSLDECRAFFNEYETGVLFRFSTLADKEKYPMDWTHDLQNRLVECEKSVFLLDYRKSFLLNMTGCVQCKECKQDRVRCVNKRSARPNPEAFGIDVYATVRKAGYDLHVVTESPAEMNRFAFLLIE